MICSCSDICLLELILVDIDEDCSDVVEELVDPREMQERLIDGLKDALSETTNNCAKQRLAHHEDQPQVLDQCPFQGVFLVSI